MKTEAFDTDVLVIGGGNAALCAALMAREAGSRVLLLNPRRAPGAAATPPHPQSALHARRAQDVLVEAYPEEEYWQDLLKVTGGITNEHLARMVIRASSTCRNWMRRHGVHFQPPLSGALHVARTNAFFMGGGKALVNAYFRSAEKLGVEIRYESPVDKLEIENGRFQAAWVKRMAASASRPKLRAGGGRLRVQPRMAARGLGPERARRMAGRQLHHPRHGLQPGRAAQAHAARAAGRRPGRSHAGAHGGHRCPRAAVRRRHLHAHRLRLAGRGGEPRCRALL
jgi:precorrin 3B synthase CobZ